MEGFKHKVPIQLRFKDVDKMGHVNNANYLTFIELARIHYFETVAGKNANWSQQLGIILARIEIDYKLPIFLRDSVFVYTKCSRLGTKSLDLSWVIVCEKNGTEEIVAQGLAVLVCYDYTQNKTISIPDDQRNALKAFEGLAS
jgi:acyl-CoA thioester hydrolase